MDAGLQSQVNRIDLLTGPPRPSPTAFDPPTSKMNLQSPRAARWLKLPSWKAHCTAHYHPQSVYSHTQVIMSLWSKEHQHIRNRACTYRSNEDIKTHTIISAKWEHAHDSNNYYIRVQYQHNTRNISVLIIKALFSYRCKQRLCSSGFLRLNRKLIKLNPGWISALMALPLNINVLLPLDSILYWSGREQDLERGKRILFVQAERFTKFIEEIKEILTCLSSTCYLMNHLLSD